MQLLFICLHPLNTIGFWSEVIHNAFINDSKTPYVSSLTKINELVYSQRGGNNSSVFHS